MCHSKFACLICGAVWGAPHVSDQEISHGICIDCIRLYYTEKIRASQIREGNVGCFNGDIRNCSLTQCSFYSFCQDATYEEWKATVIQYGKTKANL